MRFRPGQDLVNREQAVEPRRAEPLFLIDQHSPDHGDLRHRPAPGEQPELEEPREQSG